MSDDLSEDLVCLHAVVTLRYARPAGSWGCSTCGQTWDLDTATERALAVERLRADHERLLKAVQGFWAWYLYGPYPRDWFRTLGADHPLRLLAAAAPTALRAEARDE